MQILHSSLVKLLPFILFSLPAFAGQFLDQFQTFLVKGWSDDAYVLVEEDLKPHHIVEVDEFGNNILMLALGFKQDETAELIWDIFSESPLFDINSTNKDGETAFELALKHNNLDFANRVVIASPTLEIRDRDILNGLTQVCSTASHRSLSGKGISGGVCYPGMQSLSEERLDFIVYMLDTYASTDLFHRFYHHKSFTSTHLGSDDLLSYTMTQDVEAMFDYLISREDFDVNQKDSEGKTALFKASYLNVKETYIDNLLSLPDINLNSRTNNGDTPLIIAAYNGKLTAVKKLLEAGARKGLRHPKSGKKAIDFARQQGHNEIVRLLK